MENNNIIEILSPAGSWESLRAAAATGADAVYFGGSSFNARRNAENFNDDDIKQVVTYCHVRGIKAYFALNTIIFDDEIDKAMGLAAKACAAGVDAFILQDAGLAAQIHSAAPTARLHASTQMSVHNLSGVDELARMGFSRVVLARELSKKELADIACKSPIELEVFVHGAQCMSISGQCYMSAFFGGCRSGNRGLCAQPCRLPFSVGAGQNVLSLKDLTIIDCIHEIANMGVFSVKIEGRMKRPEYVAAATAACKKAVKSQKVTDEEYDALRAVFSRDGFSSGYFNGNLDREMFGSRQYEDVVSMQSALKRFRLLYEGIERQRIKVNFDFSMKREGVFLKACDSDGNSSYVSGERPEPVQIRAVDDKTVREKLAKTGSTPFLAGDINTELEPGFTIPVSEINRLRREALEELCKLRGRTREIPFNMHSQKAVKPVLFSTDECKNVEKIYLRFHSISQIPEKTDLKAVDMIFLPLHEICQGKAEGLLASGLRIGAELPRALFSGFNLFAQQLEKAKFMGVKDALCGNLGTIPFAKSAGLAVHCDFGLNISNSAALNTYKEIGARSTVLSFETPASSVRKIVSLSSIPCGLIVYGRLPLMLVRNCPVKCFCGCRGSGCAVKDRTGCEFPIICNHAKNGACEILNSRPLWLADRKQEILETGIDFIEFYFTTENAAQVSKTLEAWKNGSTFTGEFTRGMYFHPVA